MDKTYHEVLKKLHFDMHTPENILRVGEDLNVDEYVKSIKITGAQSVTLFARCGYGLVYYPSKFGMPHPNMKRDVFGEVCAALRAEGIDVTAYFSSSHIQVSQVENGGVPQDYARVNMEGEYFLDPIQDKKTYAPCPTSGFLYENLLPTIFECSERYDINAIWIDGLYGMMSGACQCDRCKTQYLKDIPNAKGMQPSRPVNRWRTDIIWEFLNSVGIGIEKIRHGMSVGADVVACLQWSQPKPEHVGFITYDPATANLAPNISLALSYVAWRGVTCDMNLQRMRTWRYFNSRPVESLCVESAICAAMNSKLIAGDIVHADTVQPNNEAMKMINTYFSYGEKIHDKVKNIPSYADVAILSSPENTRKTISKDWAVRPQVFEAVYQCILTAGLTAHILFDDDLEENLHKYKLLIIPELSFVGRNATNAIEEYVARGGKLLCVGDIPAEVDPYELDDLADKSLFQKLCGNEFLEQMECELSYIDLIGTSSERYIKGSPLTPIAVSGNVNLVKATTAKVECYLHKHGPRYQYGALPIGNKTEFTGISVNEYKKGRVIYIAQQIFTDYYDLGDFLIKRLIHGVVFENITPYARLSGASNAQLIIAKSENKICASAVVIQGDFRAGSPRIIDGCGKIADLKIHIAETRKVKTVTSVLGEKIVWASDETGILIELQPMNIYSGVVIELE